MSISRLTVNPATDRKTTQNRPQRNGGSGEMLRGAGTPGSLPQQARFSASIFSQRRALHP